MVPPSDTKTSIVPIKELSQKSEKNRAILLTDRSTHVLPVRAAAGSQVWASAEPPLPAGAPVPTFGGKPKGWMG